MAEIGRVASPGDSNQVLAVGKLPGQALRLVYWDGRVRLAMEDDGRSNDLRHPIPEVVAIHEGPERLENGFLGRSLPFGNPTSVVIARAHDHPGNRTRQRLGRTIGGPLRGHCLVSGSSLVGLDSSLGVDQAESPNPVG